MELVRKKSSNKNKFCERYKKKGGFKRQNKRGIREEL